MKRLATPLLALGIFFAYVIPYALDPEDSAGDVQRFFPSSLAGTLLALHWPLQTMYGLVAIPMKHFFTVTNGMITYKGLPGPLICGSSISSTQMSRRPVFLRYPPPSGGRHTIHRSAERSN